MMIASLFCAIKEALMNSGVFQVGYEYAELIQRNASSGATTKRPMYYEGGGYKDIQNFDVGGMFYVRKNGNTSITADTKTMQPTPCNSGTAITLNIPIKVVSAVLRSEFSDPVFADELLCSVIINALQGASISSTDLNAKAVSLQVTSTNTDSYAIWPIENQGITFSEPTMNKFAYVSVDFTVTINADSSCLATCQNQY